MKIFFSRLLGIFLTFIGLICLSGAIFLLFFALHISGNPAIYSADLSLFSSVNEKLPCTLYSFPETSVRTEKEPMFLPSLDSAEIYEVLSSPSYRYAPLSEIPEELEEAFLAIEDKRFYQHRGVDLKRTAGATLSFLLKKGDSFGGSTITQQLLKNVTGENERTAKRKVVEIFRALDLEKHLSKEEILERYLNIVSLSNGAVGVASGAKVLFGKELSELSLAECASLAAITKNPSRYDPLRHPEAHCARRNLVLREMYREGYISESEYQASLSLPLTATGAEKEKEGGVHSWYTDLVVEDVIGDLCSKFGYTREEASYMLYTGGMKIYTPISCEVQKRLESYYCDEGHFPTLSNGTKVESGMIVLDPYTGNILGVVGAVGEKRANRIQNYATGAKRSPGSALKPLSVYAPAIERGYTAASLLTDAPTRISEDGSGWPRNASGKYLGEVTLDYALSHSLNTTAAHLLTEVGEENSFRFLKETLGIGSLIDNGIASDKGAAALALGQLNYGLTLRELTAAYSIFINRGIYSAPRSYLLVTAGDGTVLLENELSQTVAIREGTAEVLTALLSNVVSFGTARALTLDAIVPTAGKTGTTQETKDRIFVGYTPYLLAGVWFGCEYPQDLSEIKENTTISIFDGVMKPLHREIARLEGRDRPSRRFDAQKLCYLRICTKSGLLASDFCTDPSEYRRQEAEREERRHFWEFFFSEGPKETQKNSDGDETERIEEAPHPSRILPFLRGTEPTLPCLPKEEPLLPLPPF